MSRHEFTLDQCVYCGRGRRDCDSVDCPARPTLRTKDIALKSEDEFVTAREIHLSKALPGNESHFIVFLIDAIRSSREELNIVREERNTLGAQWQAMSLTLETERKAREQAEEERNAALEDIRYWRTNAEYSARSGSGPQEKISLETTQQMLNALAAKTRTITSLERQLEIAREFLELNSFHSVLREMENATKN